MENRYEHTDKVIRYLIKRFIQIFGNAKSMVLPMDELNILNYSKTIYAEIEAVTEEYFLLLAKKVYADSRTDVVDGKSKKINKKWLHSVLSAYDPITKYVYLHEVERKQDRFAESVIAAQNRAEEVYVALRYWTKMINQYAIEITDAAVMEAYADDNVEKVMWLTVKDERRCPECIKRHKKIYNIDNVPSKPHIGCRCWLVPYPWEE